MSHCLPSSPPEITALPWQEPERLFALCRDEEQSVFLDSGGAPESIHEEASPGNEGPGDGTSDGTNPTGQERQRWSFLCPRPAARLSLPLADMTHFPRELRAFLAAHAPKGAEHTGNEDGEQARKAPPPARPAFPFTGGVVGLLSYEAGMACERLTSRHQSDCPAFTALACRDLFIIDRVEKKLWWASADGTPPPALPASTPARPARLADPAGPTSPTTPYSSSASTPSLSDQAIARNDADDATRDTTSHASSHTSAQSPHLTPMAEQDATTWQTTMERVRDYIGAGDIFQANLTMRWVAARPAGLDLHALYSQLRTHCPAPFGAWFSVPGLTLLSASVERFLSLDGQGNIETRPIKGTCPISPDPQQNEALKAALREDEKELAENLMITDLMRHDIGKVCQLGSVAVPQLFAVERFAHVHHLVSSVTGQLQPGCDAADLLAATIPPGSVTGAPKYRAMEIIDEVESSARGAYCGTLFRLGWDGGMDSAVIIRSISATDEQLRLGAGGGITYPSQPEREYEEMCLKAAPLLKVMEDYGRDDRGQKGSGRDNRSREDHEPEKHDREDHG